MLTNVYYIQLCVFSFLRNSVEQSVLHILYLRNTFYIFYKFAALNVTVIHFTQNRNFYFTNDSFNFIRDTFILIFSQRLVSRFLVLIRKQNDTPCAGLKLRIFQDLLLKTGRLGLVYSLSGTMLFI
jgi:hypothetical protein